MRVMSARCWMVAVAAVFLGGSLVVAQGPGMGAEWASDSAVLRWSGHLALRAEAGSGGITRTWSRS